MKFQENQQLKDIKYMSLALKEAKKAYEENEVPVGCVIVYNNKVIAKAHNLRIKHNNALEHAELIAIKKACKKINSWILDGASIYITLEPCLMCSGAILQSRISNVIYATSEPKFGAIESIVDIFNHDKYKFNHTVNIRNNILQEECSNLLKDFFKNLRDKKNDTN